MSLQSSAPRNLSVTEPLDLRFLPDDGLELDEPLRLEWLAALLAEARIPESELAAAGPGHARLEVQPMGPVATRPAIRIHGVVEARLRTACVRCLSPVEEALAAQLDVTLFSEEKAPAREEEIIDESTPDEAVYAGNTIDLPGLLREALLLELSPHPTCADEPACDARTAALLAEANRAAEAATDDRWAPLKALMPVDGPGGDEN